MIPSRSQGRKVKEANEGGGLKSSSQWDGVDGGETVKDGLEGGFGGANVTWETDSVLLDEVTSDCKHEDTSVLDLDVTEMIELLLVTVGDHAGREG